MPSWLISIVENDLLYNLGGNFLVTVHLCIINQFGYTYTVDLLKLIVLRFAHHIKPYCGFFGFERILPTVLLFGKPSLNISCFAQSEKCFITFAEVLYLIDSYA